MIQTTKTLVIGILVATTLATASFGQTIAESSSVYATMLGNAVTAKTFGAEAVAKNPAGIGTTDGIEIGTAVSSAFDQSVTGFDGFAAFNLTPSVSIAVNIPVRLISDIIKTNEAGDITGTLSDIAASGYVGASYQVSDSLTLGASLHMHYTAVADYTTAAAGVDLGLISKVGTTVIGLSLQNAVQTGLNTIKLNAGIQTEVAQGITVLADITAAGSSTLTMNIGGEYELVQGIVVGFGASDVASGAQLHSGVSFDFNGVQVDYGYSLHGDLGGTHQIGVKVVLN